LPLCQLKRFTEKGKQWDKLLAIGIKGGVRPNSGSQLAEFLGLEAEAISSWNPREIIGVTGICMQGHG
jgi:hypothetical protein